MNDQRPIKTASRIIAGAGDFGLRTGLGIDHLATARLHPELVEELGFLGIATPPTLRDKARILHAVFGYHESHIPQWPAGELSLKDALISILMRSDYNLSATEQGMQKLWLRKHAAWVAGGKTLDAILDARKGRVGRNRRKLCSTCRKLMVSASVDQDGNISMAFRRLHTRKAFCQDCASAFPFDPMHKSYVPACIRADIRPDVLKALDFRRGVQFSKLNGPHVRRIPDFGPGDIFIADDVTFNTAWWHQEPGGPVIVNKGECLLATDERTQYPLGYVLISSPIVLPGDDGFVPRMRRASYTSRHCRLLLLHVADIHGIPHREFKLENGNWRAGCMTDLPKQDWKPVQWQEASQAMEASKLGFTLRYVKPRSPTSKAVIERKIGYLQEMTRPESGLLGFCERFDKREDADEIVRQVRAQTLKPNGLLPSMAQMCAVLDKTLVEFRQEKQNGMWLPGVSPEEAWLDGIKNPGGELQPGIKARPLRQHPPELRYYLATYRTKRKVRNDGVQIGCHTYWGSELEPFKHQEVEIRCDMEDLSVIYISMPDSQKWVAVKEMTELASTATSEQQKYVNRQKAAFMRPGRILFDSLSHPFRTSLVDESAHGTEDDKAAGRAIDTAKAKLISERNSAKAQQDRIKRLAQEAGCVMPASVRDPVALEKHYRRRIAERAGEGCL